MKKIIKVMKSFSLKFKALFIAAFGFIGFLGLFFLSKKINAKEILELELKNIRDQIKIKETEGNIKENEVLISTLEQKASIIKDEIEQINSGKKPKVISEKDLDLFFKKRGF